MATLLSIITPTYNSAAHLNGLLQSYKDQTNKEFEIIFVDGQSTDNTLATLKAFKNQHQDDFEKIALISEPDTGIYNAMNKGLQLALGEWILFLGSDDFLYDQHLIADFFSIKKKQAPNANFVYGKVFFDKTKQIYGHAFTLNQLVNKNISHQGIFAKKELIMKYGGFNEKYKICADHALNIQIFATQYHNTFFWDRIVAVFGQGGVSSTQHDALFRDHDQLSLFKSNTHFGSYLIIFVKYYVGYVFKKKLMLASHYFKAFYKYKIKRQKH